MRFYLLGAIDTNNPKHITLETLLLWDKENIINYLGNVQDVREYIANASCIVLPSIYKEGIPRSLLEAMAMGKPIITTNVSGCKECIAPPLVKKDNFWIGKNGILIPPKDFLALKNAMKFLKNNPHLFSQMKESALNLAQNRFNIYHTIHFYKTQIKHLLPSISSSPTHTQNKRIAFICNSSFGMYNFRLKVLEALQNEGYEIHIIVPYDTTSDKLKQQGFVLHHFFIDNKSKNPLKDIKTILQIKEILLSISPMMLFSYTIKCVIYGSAIANHLKIPNIAIITGLGYVFIDGNIFKKILKFIVCKMHKISLKKTSQVWFLNNDDKNEFLIQRIAQESKMYLLDSEGVDTKHFSPDFKPKQNQVLEEKFKNDEFSFLLMARMLWDKGIGEFVQAARILKKHQNYK